MKCRVSGKETVEVFNLGELLMSDFTPDGDKINYNALRNYNNSK